MEVKFDETRGKFAIVGLTFEQLDHILNCIAYATQYGARMPKKNEADPNRRRVNIETAKQYKK